MGSVNRCWRCGQEFVANRGAGDVPPVRRSPVETAAVWEASLADSAGEHGSSVTPAMPHNQRTETKMVRRGSPFSDRGSATVEEVMPDDGDPTLGASARGPLVEYERTGGSDACAGLSVPLGLVCLGMAFWFPLAGIPIAIIGLGFGIWGLRSRRRGWAIAGLLICCLGLGTATFNKGVDLYTQIYGVSPWEPESQTVPF